MQVYGNQYDVVNNDLPYGLVVRIPGFHPGGPGSIPGLGASFWLIFLGARFSSEKWIIIYFGNFSEKSPFFGQHLILMTLI